MSFRTSRFISGQLQINVGTPFPYVLAHLKGLDPKAAGRALWTRLDKFASAEILNPGTSGMKKEFSEKLRMEIGRSLELLERSKALASELEETVERSRNLLDQSYRIIDRLRARSRFKENPGR